MIKHILTLALILCPLTAMAQDKVHETPVRQAVEIVSDQTAKRFIFMIDGEPVAVLDSTGLRVRDDIVFGGKIVDSGREVFGASAEPKGPTDAE